MGTWTEIVTRELVMLVALVALGIGPAFFLGRRFDAAARLAMAPVLGLCVGTCVFTTLIWFTAARHTYWLLPLLAALSVAVALRRGRAMRPKPKERSRRSGSAPHALHPRDMLALAVVCVVVAAPLSYTLHERDSVGPIGYRVSDAAGYASTADGMEQQSIRRVDRPEPENVNLALQYWVMIAHTNANIDAAPLSANLNELIGMGSTETQSLFLIVFLVAGALGAFAAVRYAAPKPGWAAPLAGVLFAGPLFLQLMADGSQAATCGLGLILPIAAVGAEVLRRRRLADLVLLALLASGLLALYPLIVPAVLVTAAVALFALAVRASRRGELGRRALVAAAAQVGILLALSVVFDLVSFMRDARYWSQVLHGGYIDNSALPQFNLPISVLPGWLAQTREFYALSSLDHAPIGQLLVGVILPAVFIVAIVSGLRRRPGALILVVLLLVCAALAEYTSVRYHCSYCVDRNMLPAAPAIVGLFALGVAALATAPTRWLRWVGVVVAVVAVIAVANSARQERVRFANGSYILSSGNRALLSRLPPHPGPVDIEGYGEALFQGPRELPLVYTLVSERNHEEVSVPTELSDNNSFAYLGGAKPDNPILTPGYRYVLTRLGGVQTGRRVIARAGPLALEERTSPLDATVVAGLAVPPVRADAQGLASVVGPLHLIVVGGGSAPAWIQLRFQTIAPAAAPPQPGVQARATPHTLIACVQATGTAPVRQATLILEGTLFSGPQPTEQFAWEEPPQGIELVSMRVLTHCSPTGSG